VREVGTKRILAKILNFLERNGFRFNVEEFEDRLRLQKYIYLFKYCGLDPGYNFSFYLRGPYSSDLADDYYDPEMDRIRKEEDATVPESVVRLWENIKDKDNTWLEIAASLVMAVKEYGLRRDVAIRMVSKAKDMDASKVESVFRDLEKFKLLPNN